MLQLPRRWRSSRDSCVTMLGLTSTNVLNRLREKHAKGLLVGDCSLVSLAVRPFYSPLCDCLQEGGGPGIVLSCESHQYLVSNPNPLHNRKGVLVNVVQHFCTCTSVEIQPLFLFGEESGFETMLAEFGWVSGHAL